VILRTTSGVHDVCFIDVGHLLSGTATGDVEVWDLEDRRIAKAWHATDGAVLAVHGLEGGRACLSQGKEGWLHLWDVETKALRWKAFTGSCSFARSLLMASAGGDPLDADPTDCTVCSPLAAPHLIGVFDIRAAGEKRCELALGGSAFVAQRTKLATANDATNPLGMCMALCRMPSLGPWHVLAVYESTDTCVWDLRLPQKPVMPSILAGDPNSPAICATVLWKKAWVACADGSISVVRARERLQLATAAVQASAVPYTAARVDVAGGSRGGQEGPEVDNWQAEKRGVNVLAARPDLRLVAAARWDHRIELFDVKTSQSLGRLRCHDAGVNCAAFDRKRGAFATGSEDGRIALWGVLADTYTGPYMPCGSTVLDAAPAAPLGETVDR